MRRVPGVNPLYPPERQHGYNPGMTILLAALCAAFAAFAMWLAVRIINRRERWAKRTAVALVGVLVVYPLSFGPACWVIDRWDRVNINGVCVRCTAKVYAPIVQLAFEGPSWISGPIQWWASVGTEEPESALAPMLLYFLADDPRQIRDVFRHLPAETSISSAPAFVEK
jgi:hypothetical protein